MKAILCFSFIQLCLCQVANQRELVRQGGMGNLIQLMTTYDDEDLNRAIKFVLQCCVQAGAFVHTCEFGSKEKVPHLV